MSRRARLILVPAVALASGCAAVPADPAADPPGATSPSEQRYTVSATVLESPDHGPQLCHAVAESLPPQCGGPDVVGWDWASVAHESVNGTTWGSYVLVGAFDGSTFTLTTPVTPDDGSRPGRAGADFSSPCLEPAGDWTPPDPSRAT